MIAARLRGNDWRRSRSSNARPSAPALADTGAPWRLWLPADSAPALFSWLPLYVMVATSLKSMDQIRLGASSRCPSIRL